MQEVSPQSVSSRAACYVNHLVDTYDCITSVSLPSWTGQCMLDGLGCSRGATQFADAEFVREAWLVV